MHRISTRAHDACLRDRSMLSGSVYLGNIGPLKVKGSRLEAARKRKEAGEYPSRLTRQRAMRKKNRPWLQRAGGIDRVMRFLVDMGTGVIILTVSGGYQSQKMWEFPFNPPLGG